MLDAAENLGRKKDKLFNFRPAFFAAIFLILGILFGYYKVVYDVSGWWLLLGVPILIAPLVFSENKRELFVRAVTITLLLSVFFFGFVCFRHQLYDYSRCGYYNGEYTVTGTVVSYADSGTSIKVVLKDISIGGEEEKGLVNAYLPAIHGKDIRVADIVVIEGRVRTDTAYFDEYLKANAINSGARFYIDKATSYQRAGRSKDIFLLIRDRVEQVVFTGMDKMSASITLGVLTGDDTKIEGALLDNIRKGGVAHIFAVSGLHVGALYAFVSLLFTKTRLKKAGAVVQFIALASVLLFYAGICGFSASIVRATTLCLVGYCMRKLGGESDSLNILGVAAIIILLCTPCALFEVGFQLSFTACLGILLFSKRMGYVWDELHKVYRRRFPRNYTEEELKIIANGDTLPLTMGERFYRAFTSLLSASISAQLFTAPLQYMAFGYFSGWSFLLNIIFVPLISAVFAVLLLCVFLSCILPLWCSTYILYVPAILSNLALLVFEVGDFSSFVITDMQLSGATCVCYYGGVIFFTDKWNVSKRQKLFLAGAFFTAFLVILALLNL